MKKKSVAALGEKLVRQCFSDPASIKLAKGFQSVHQDGARNREEEYATLKQLGLRRLNLSDFKVTRRENLLIVTYAAAVQEAIDAQETTSEPAYRLSVFIESGKDWLLLTHANLIAMNSRSAE